jgi:hypothetical protein
MQQSGAFSRLGVLDVPSSTPPRPSGRKRHISRHLAGLVKRGGEKCGLSRALLLALVFVVSGTPAFASGRTAVLSNLEINEPVSGDVIVFGADLELGPLARVDGDAVAVGGDVRVAEGAVVARHVVAVFGGAEVSGGAHIGGRVFSFSSLATLLPSAAARQPSVQASVSMHLLTAGGWLLVTTGLAFLFPTRMRFGGWALPNLGIKVVALGMLTGLTVVAALVAALGLGPALGVPLVAGLMVVFFAAKAVGLTVLACWLGAVLLQRCFRHPAPISLEVFVGVLVLLGLRFLPMVGDTAWTLISLIALGASIVFIGVSTDLVGVEDAGR